MPITINGSGTVTGISAGGLPDGVITAPDLDGAQTGSAPIYGCRAWVNFNGTGAIGTNQTIRASGNVASVYKNGTGDYMITFATPMPDANYCACVNSGNSAAGSTGGWTTAYSVGTSTASSLRVTGYSIGGAFQDQDQMMVAIFR